jgi:hypothetical protein
METSDRGSAHADGALPVNPYGGKPSSGSQFPPYYTPTPSVRTRNNYYRLGRSRATVKAYFYDPSDDNKRPTDSPAR